VVKIEERELIWSWVGFVWKRVKRKGDLIESRERKGSAKAWKGEQSGEG
jgi:hypothetical protein